MTYARRISWISCAVRWACLGMPTAARLALAEAYQGIREPGPDAIAVLESVAIQTRHGAQIASGDTSQEQENPNADV